MSDVSELESERLLEIFNRFLLDDSQWDSSLELSYIEEKTEHFRRGLSVTLRFFRIVWCADHQRRWFKRMGFQRAGVQLYVSLYQQEGKNLMRWERVLRSIASLLHLVGRFTSLRHRQNADSFKGSYENEGYAVLRSPAFSSAEACAGAGAL